MGASLLALAWHHGSQPTLASHRKRPVPIMCILVPFWNFEQKSPCFAKARATRRPDKGIRGKIFVRNSFVILLVKIWMLYQNEWYCWPDYLSLTWGICFPFFSWFCLIHVRFSIKYNVFCSKNNVFWAPPHKTMQNHLEIRQKVSFEPETCKMAPKLWPWSCPDLLLTP